MPHLVHCFIIQTVCCCYCDCCYCIYCCYLCIVIAAATRTQNSRLKNCRATCCMLLAQDNDGGTNKPTNLGTNKRTNSWTNILSISYAKHEPFWAAAEVSVGVESWKINWYFETATDSIYFMANAHTVNCPLPFKPEKMPSTNSERNENKNRNAIIKSRCRYLIFYGDAVIIFWYRFYYCWANKESNLMVMGNKCQAIKKIK